MIRSSLPPPLPPLLLLLLTFAKLAARTDINKLMNGKGEPTNYISWCGAATLNEGEISSATR
jgi:hypothetical protein